MNKTQSQHILEHLQSGKSITAIDALNLFGCFRLAARINDLKKEGWKTKSEPFKTSGGATISRYILAEAPTQPASGYSDKLVRDLEVGDKLHPSTFDLSEAPSPVTITSINPYGTSYHSLIIRGECEWDNGEIHTTGPLIFDKLTKTRAWGRLDLLTP